MTNQNHLRQQPRFAFNRPGRIRIGDGAEQKTQLADLSLGGASLYYSQPVKPGAPVVLSFGLNVGYRVECTVYGVVRHYSVRGTSHVVGVEFTHLEPQAYEAIQEFVQQRRDLARTHGAPAQHAGV